MTNPYRQFDYAIQKYETGNSKWHRYILSNLANWLPDSFQFVRRWKGGHWECWRGYSSLDTKKWFRTLECNHTKNVEFADQERKKKYLDRDRRAENYNFYKPAGEVEVHICCEDW